MLEWPAMRTEMYNMPLSELHFSSNEFAPLVTIHSSSSSLGMHSFTLITAHSCG